MTKNFENKKIYIPSDIMVFTRKSQVYYKLTEKRPIGILKQFEKKLKVIFFI